MTLRLKQSWESAKSSANHLLRVQCHDADWIGEGRSFSGRERMICTSSGQSNKPVARQTHLGATRQAPRPCRPSPSLPRSGTKPFWSLIACIILTLLFPFSGYAATWFVRPGVYDGPDSAGNPVPRAGVYGFQNGTSYDNAWNGLGSIQRGLGGVVEGDTLYFCGTHVYPLTTNTAFGKPAIACVSRTTYRGDWPGDPGIICVGALDSRPETVWNGPDENGVYWCPQTSFNGKYASVRFQIHDGAIIPLKQKTTTTWEGALGSFASINNITYVKTVNGDRPDKNMVLSKGGWRFWLTGSSERTNMTFRGLTILGSSYFITSEHTKNITIEKCRLLYGATISLSYGNDHWIITDTEIGYTGNGVYNLINKQPSGANNVIVNNCYIHDCGIDEYVDGDGHGVGIQGGSYWTITSNRFERTGTAIEFWTGTRGMSNNVVAHNFIKDVYARRVSRGHGISVSGSNANSPVGYRTGFQIYNNVIMNTGLGGDDTCGRGISSNNKDPMFICNNTIYGATNGIKWIILTGETLAGTVKNNIIANTSDTSISLYTTGTMTADCDHNLFYNTKAPATSPVIEHNTHSIFGKDPLFVSQLPKVLADFRLQAGSPAIRAGAPVGLTVDIAGNPIPARMPDIGAFQSTTPTTGTLAPPLDIEFVPASGVQ